MSDQYFLAEGEKKEICTKGGEGVEGEINNPSPTLPPTIHASSKSNMASG